MTPGPHGPGQFNGTVANPDQPADRVAGRLPEAANEPVAPLPHDHAKPAIGGPLARGFERVETRRTVIEIDASPQPLQDLRRDFAKDPHHVLADQTAGGVHQRMRKGPVGGHEQQAGGGEVEPAHADPAPAQEWRESLEDGRTLFRIVAGADLTGRLVVEQCALTRPGPAQGNDRPAIDGDVLAPRYPLAKRGLYPVDRDPTGANPGFDFAARAEAGASEHLLQALGITGHPPALPGLQGDNVVRRTRGRVIGIVVAIGVIGPGASVRKTIVRSGGRLRGI